MSMLVRRFKICKEGRQYQLEPESKPFEMDRTELKLLLARTLPVLSFMGAEACAHGIFPSEVGIEMAHTLTDIRHRIALASGGKRPTIRVDKRIVAGGIVAVAAAASIGYVASRKQSIPYSSKSS